MLNAIIEYSDNSFREKSKIKCSPCNHPTQCAQDCETCLKQVHYPSYYPNGRKDYSCTKIIDFYTCKYAYKYASEIEYALRQTPCVNDFKQIHMLSIGCGPSPDLMAVHHYMRENFLEIPIQYFGFDHNVLWKPIHEKINTISSEYGIKKVGYFDKDVIEYFSNKELGKANILTLQYVISHITNDGRRNEMIPFFNDLVKNVISKMERKSIIIINDINHNSVRDRFISLHNAIKEHGIQAERHDYYFDYQIKNNFQRFGTRHERKSIIYHVPGNIMNRYNPWTDCSSVQSIIELG